MAKFISYIEVADLEIEVTIDYDYMKGSTGNKNKYGVPTEPCYPSEVIINSITDNYGKAYKASEEVLEKFRSDIIEDIDYANDPNNQEENK